MANDNADMGYPGFEAVVKATRKKNFGHPAAWAELIDNSLGNGATEVRCGQSKDEGFSIVDNGTGCTDAMFSALLTIGKHEENPTVSNPTSFFGIGSADAVLFIGAVAKYASIRKPYAFFHEVDWDAMSEKYAPQPTMRGIRAMSQARAMGIKDSGVAINVYPVTRRLYFDSVKRKMKELFWPAAEHGATITLFRDDDEYVIEPKEMPTFVKGKTLTREVTLGSGNRIKITGGIMDPAVRMEGGFEYIVGHRVLIPPCGHGAGDADYDRVYFRVYLLGHKADWELERNKAGLMDEDMQLLEDAVYVATQHLLDDDDAKTLVIPGPDDDVDDVLNDLLGSKRGKAKRPKDGGKRGTVKPKGTSRKAKEAAIVDELEPDDVQERQSNRKSPVAGLRVKRTSSFDEADFWKLAKVDVSNRRVWLNENNDVIAKLYEGRDVMALLAVISAQWCMAVSIQTATGQKLMMVEDCTFDMFQRKMTQMLGRADRCQTAK